MPSGRAPAYQLLADDLREKITSGQLRPGQRLPTEPELCVRSGVSRSTVREALRLLASQHLIVTTRGVTGGSYVAKPDAATIAGSLARGVTLLVSATPVGICELMEVRDLLEVPAAGLAARRRTDADLAALAKALFDPIRDDTPAKVAAQRAFHESLAAATGNPVYELLARPLYAVANATEIAERAPLRLWRSIDADHRAILRAVTARDTPAAERAARMHLANLRAALPEE
jgi:GntR family transcriptional regulator, transcriptional repressor for pyruvate dehydrogenase complex